ncbi:hypothetical protein DERF_009198 [Dermatophagoides farinae]|uniref:Secreted protein n=1 Tax=Dermatophagoides farinae TaxID=6954 RepID=A0A922HWE9_DERFA|nr:hypothetical protein DERF_009198 [Dermatophagoides farinae]
MVVAFLTLEFSTISALTFMDTVVAESSGDSILENDTNDGDDDDEHCRCGSGDMHSFRRVLPGSIIAALVAVIDSATRSLVINVSPNFVVDSHEPMTMAESSES